LCEPEQRHERTPLGTGLVERATRLSAELEGKRQSREPSSAAADAFKAEFRERAKYVATLDKTHNEAQRLIRALKKQNRGPPMKETPPWIKLGKIKTGPSRFLLRRSALLFTCLFLVGVIGFVDYLTGYERPLLLFYLLPISLGAWFDSFLTALGIAVISIAVSTLSDVAAGIPALGFWNVGMSFISYALFAGVLSKLRTLVGELDRRVQERTAALQREVAERQRLDREIAQVADRERRRLGQDLHDRLGQHLTGTALAAQVLKDKLATKSAPEVPEAEKLVRYVEEGIDLTRNLARGFFSPELEADGLSVALEGLAENISERFAVNCVFHGEASIPVRDSAVATQLYRIAQEAATNAAKHAAAENIDIRVAVDGSELTLVIIDDGTGLPDKLSDSKGLGLRLMRHGAALIDAALSLQRNGRSGTVATCKLRIPNNSESSFAI
jgi:signal transduction histidine kinase